MCPITTVSTERGIPAAWKKSSSEIPNTTYGITSGLSSSAEIGDFSRKRRRTSAIEASTPSSTAPMLEIAATTALVSSAESRSALTRNWWYQCSVNPLSGNEGNCESLNENTTRIAIGAYRKITTSAKNDRSSHAPWRERATFIRPSPRALQEAREDDRQHGDDAEQ